MLNESPFSSHEVLVFNKLLQYVMKRYLHQFINTEYYQPFYNFKNCYTLVFPDIMKYFPHKAVELLWDKFCTFAANIYIYSICGVCLSKQTFALKDEYWLTIFNFPKLFLSFKTLQRKRDWRNQGKTKASNLVM